MASALVVTGVLVMAGFPSAASAEEVLSESCGGIGAYLTTGDGNVRAGQSFTASRTGTLTRAEIAIRRETDQGSGTYIVDVLAGDGSGVPTNTLLARAFVPDTDVPADVDSTLNVAFSPGAPLSVGDPYAVVVARPGADDNLLRFSDPCIGGAYFSPGPAPAAFQEVLMGDSDLRMDIFFTVPEPATPEPAQPAPPSTGQCRGEPATIVGTPGPDTLTGTPARDVVAGGAAADVIAGLGGNDEICGDEGADRIGGGPGRDLIRGGADADRLKGGPDSDRLIGGPGKDRCAGGGDLDRIRAC